MLYLDKNTTIPSVEQTLNTLKLHNSMMPNYIDYDMLLMSIFKLNKLIDDNNRAFFSALGITTAAKKDSALKTLIIRNNLRGRFAETGTGEISLNKESIAMAVQSGLPEDIVQIIHFYMAASTYEKLRGQLVPFLQNPISTKLSFDGHRMLEVVPEWSAQNTGRVAMSKPAIQNMSREIQNLLTVPQGYKLIHTDSGQVEPRIVYSTFIQDKQIQELIRLYDDAYYGILHYVTMPEQYIHDQRMTFEKREITEEMKAGRKKIKTYGNAVMYGSTSNKEGDPVKDAMIQRIGNHPSRLSKIREIKDNLQRGNTVFKTYFGTSIDISKSKKIQEGSSYGSQEDLIRLAINNPIQGTAADLMRYSVYSANKLLMGCRDSYIVNYVHDAGVFCVSEDEYDKVGKELMDIVSYHVDGWLPVSADGEIREHITSNVFTKFPY